MKRGIAALATIPFILAGFGCWVAFIFTEVTDVGELGVLLLSVSLLAWIVLGLSCIEEGPIRLPRMPRRWRDGLTREQRQRVKRAQAEAHTRVLIAQAEADAVAAENEMRRARS